MTTREQRLTLKEGKVEPKTSRSNKVFSFASPKNNQQVEE